jgi:hypothetical protein
MERLENYFFTQSGCVLFDSAPALEEVERALEAWPVVGKQAPAAGDDGWIASGPGWVIELRNRTGVIVDVVDRPWPDDPRAAVEVPGLASAWRAGIFGPSAAPGALARAKVQSWGWAEGKAAAERHQGFVRLRTVVKLSSAEGKGDLPKGHDPIHELTTLTELAGTLLRLPGATAFFLPGGEALRGREHVADVLKQKTGVGPPPLELWSNVRMVGLGQEGGTRWMLVDVVGMRQLRLVDQEALFADGQEDPDAVMALLRNACLHLVAGRPLPEGSTSEDARRRRWKASSATGLLAPPNRAVLRWTPEESASPSQAFLATLQPR